MPRQSYPTDLTDAQWEKVVPLLPQPKQHGRTGRPRVYAYRDILDALFYQVRSGGAWRMLPHDFPPWDTIYGYFRRWKRDGTWERIHDALREQVRTQAGKETTPSAAILDSQSVKTTEKGGSKATMRAKKSKGASVTSW
jgi:putative transposase